MPQNTNRGTQEERSTATEPHDHELVRNGSRVRIVFQTQRLPGEEALSAIFRSGRSHRRDEVKFIMEHASRSPRSIRRYELEVVPLRELCPRGNEIRTSEVRKRLRESGLRTPSVDAAVALGARLDYDDFERLGCTRLVVLHAPVIGGIPARGIGQALLSVEPGVRHVRGADGGRTWRTAWGEDAFIWGTNTFPGTPAFVAEVPNG